MAFVTAFGCPLLQGCVPPLGASQPSVVHLTSLSLSLSPCCPFSRNPGISFSPFTPSFPFSPSLLPRLPRPLLPRAGPSAGPSMPTGFQRAPRGGENEHRSCSLQTGGSAFSQSLCFASLLDRAIPLTFPRLHPKSGIQLSSSPTCLRT